METEKPFVVLLFTTIVVCIFVVIFNAVLRNEYSVFVTYDYPEEAQQKTAILQTEHAEKSQEMYEQSVDEATPAELPAELPEPDTVVFPLELNQARFEELLLIPKVGEVTATRILQYRQELGGYSDISQLLEIKGIGEASYEVISAYVYLTGDDWDKARRESP